MKKRSAYIKKDSRHTMAKPVSPKAKSQKIVDIAHPGDVTPDVGSKPMIVGHNSNVKDTTVVDDAKMVSRKSKKLQPLTIASDGSSPEQSETAPEPPAQIDEAPQETPESPTPEAAGKKDRTTDPHEEGVAPKELDPMALQMERDNALQKMIESRKYRVNIRESASWSFGKVLGAIVGLALLLGVGGFILMDTDTIDGGDSLPFRVFGSNAVPAQSAQTVPVKQVQETAVPTAEQDPVSATDVGEPTPVESAVLDTTDWFVYETSEYSIGIPDGFSVSQKESTTTSLYSSQPLTYEEGTPGEVTEYVNSGGPSEFSYGLYLDFSGDVLSDSCEGFGSESVVQSSFLTDDDVSVMSYRLEGVSAPDEPQDSQLAPGDAGYIYCVQDGQRRIVAGYTTDVDEDPAVPYIEAAIRTIRFATEP